MRGAQVAQSVERLTSAQVVISQSVSSSPALGSVLTARAWSLLQILCLPLSLPLPAHALSLSLRNKYFLKFKRQKRKNGSLELLEEMRWGLRGTGHQQCLGSLQGPLYY